MAGSIENTKAILRLAAPRGGVCTRAELLAAGVGRGAIDGRVKLGFLTPIRRGVYVGNALRNSSTPLHAAVMSVPASIVSHLTAAVVNEFPVEPPPLGSPVHLIAANGTNRRTDGGAGVPQNTGAR